MDNVDTDVVSPFDAFLRSPEYQYGLNATKHFEGFRENLYNDPRSGKKNTIGYGYNTDVYKDLPKRMDRTQANAFFPTPYHQAIRDAEKFVGPFMFWGLPPMQKLAVIDMAYNMGGDKLAGFQNFQKLLQDTKTLPIASKEMVNSDWYNQVGDRSKFWVNNWNAPDSSPLKQFSTRKN